MGRSADIWDGSCTFERAEGLYISFRALIFATFLANRGRVREVF